MKFDSRHRTSRKLLVLVDEALELGKQAEIAGYSRLVPYEEIIRNDFNLNIPRYIDGSDPEDLQDIQAHLKGGVPNRDLDLLSEFWEVMPGVRATLFGPNPREGYSDPLVEPEDVRTTIRNHPEFAAFRDRVHAILDGWAGQNAPLLNGIQIGDKPKSLIHMIAEDMLTRFTGAPLIDPYEAYQRLMSYWADTMQDDVFIIAHDGWDAAKELRIARHEKSDDGKKTKWLEEAHLTVSGQRLVADVVPPKLVVARFFPEMQKTLDMRQARVEELGAELAELVEEHAVEGGLLEFALSSSGKLTAASIKDRRRYGQPDPEENLLLIRANTLLKQEKDAKKLANEAEAALTKAILEKYPELTDKEIRFLVVNDKWLTDIAELIEAEIEARTEQLTARVRVLTERYGHTLPEIADAIDLLSAKVFAHLEAMGFAR
jgi:type I restriction enzyme M protein